MKKLLIVLLALILIAAAVIFFWPGGRDAVSDFFTENNDFGSFFDTDPQSQNDFIPGPGTTATSTPVVPGPYMAPILRQISMEPISGYTFSATTSTSTRTVLNPERGELVQEFLATSTVVRFQERATGHVYDVFEFQEPPIKASNITVQKIYNAVFTNDYNAFLTQVPTFNNEQIETSLFTIIPAKPETATASSTEQSLRQSVLSSALTNLSFIPGTNKILYALNTLAGSEVYMANPDRTGETRVTTIPFTEYSLESLGNALALVQTKASAQVPGYAYALTLSNGSLNKLLGDIRGLLVKANSDLSYYIYSESAYDRPIIRGVERASGTTRQIGIQTIPEKCVFSARNKAWIYCFGSVAYKSATYPDDWYKGKIFNDEDLYRIDLSNGSIETIYVFENNTFDVINPQLSPAEDMIGFQSKYDLTLWAIDLDALNNDLI